MPPTQSQPRRCHFSLVRWTAVSVKRPSLAIVECGTYVTVLLSRDTEPSGSSTTLHAIQLIRIPMGWRWRLLMLLASVATVRLPDEWQFNDATIDQHGEFVDAPPMLRTLSLQAPIVALTGPQYHTLLCCTGRVLRSRVMRFFPALFPERQRRATRLEALVRSVLRSLTPRAMRPSR